MSEEQYEVEVTVTCMEIDGIFFLTPDEYLIMGVGKNEVPIIFIETAGIKELDVIFKRDHKLRVWWDVSINEETKYGVLLLHLQFQNRERTHLCICFDDYEEQSDLAHKLEKIEYMLLARYSERDNKIVIPIDKNDLLQALEKFP